MSSHNLTMPARKKSDSWGKNLLFYDRMNFSASKLGKVAGPETEKWPDGHWGISETWPHTKNQPEILKTDGVIAKSKIVPRGLNVPGPKRAFYRGEKHI